MLTLVFVFSALIIPFAAIGAYVHGNSVKWYVSSPLFAILAVWSEMTGICLYSLACAVATRQVDERGPYLYASVISACAGAVCSVPLLFAGLKYSYRINHAITAMMATSLTLATIAAIMVVSQTHLP